MTKRRKPRAPEVSEQGIAALQDVIVDDEIFALANRLEFLEEMRKDGVLNKPYIALEALGAFVGGLISGKTEEQLKSTWPKEWGEETATVPLALLVELASAWDDYRQAPTGKTLGEAFKIEGGSAGRRPMKVKLAKVDRARSLAQKVEIEYLAGNSEGEDVRLADAIQKVADAPEVSFQTVKDAHDKYRARLRNHLYKVGLLKGVKTSKG